MSSFTTPLEYVDTKTKNKIGLELYQVTAPFSYKVGSLIDPILTIDVPVGFITDFATIPAPINILFHPDGPWAKAAVIHDFLYSELWKFRDDDISREIKDGIFLEAMLVLKVNVILAHIFFLAVRIFSKDFQQQ